MRLTGAALSVLTLGFASAVQAEDEKKPSEDSGDPVIVVSATRSSTKTPTDRLDLTQVVDIVSGELIEAQQGRDLSDILRNVPGAVVTSEAGFGTPNIALRGFLVDADSSLRRNGVETSRIGNMYRPNVDYVEVLKGPSSVAYGALEPGGIVNVVTLKPQAEAGLRLLTRADSFGDVQQIVDATGPLNASGTVRYRAIGSAQRFKSFRDRVDGFHYFLAPSISFVPSDRTTLTLEYERNREAHPHDPGIFRPNGLAGVGRDDRDLFLGLPGRDALFAYDSIHAALDQKLGDAFVVRGYANYTDYDITRRSGILSGGSFSPVTQRLNRFSDFADVDQRNFEADINITASFTLLGEHTLTAGFQHQQTRFDEVRFSGTLTPLNVFTPELNDGVIGAPNRLRQIRTNTDGLYLRDSISFGDKLTVLAGLRYSDYTNVIITTPQPVGATTRLANPSQGTVFSLGGIYKPQPNWGIFLSYSEGFLPINPLIGVAQDGSPFRPIEDRQYELGIKADFFDRRLQFTASIYDLQRDGVVSFAQNAQGFFIPQQGGVNRSRGIELSLIGRLTQSLDVSAAYAYVDAQVRENDPQYRPGTDLGAPRHVGNLFVNWHVTPKLDLSGGVYALSRHATFLSSAAAGRYIPGYALVQVGGSLALAEKIRLVMQVRNLFDVNHSVQFTTANITIPGQPRAVFASLDVRF